MDSVDINVQNVNIITGDILKKKMYVETLIVQENIHLLEKELELEQKVRKLLMLKHGKDSKNHLLMLKYHVLLLKDIQLLLDGEMMLIMLLQGSIVSNHIVLLENSILQLIH